jgi:hypothetical protein
MNKELRRQFKMNSWSRKEGLLQYFRAKGCYIGLGGQTNANPYWYGTILDFNILLTEIKNLIAEKSLSFKKLNYIFLLCEDDDLSPIVRLTGKVGLRWLEKIEKES